MRLLLASFLFLFLPASAMAQGTLGEWQRVAYEMDLSLRADRHQMHGTQRLTLENQSPDTLRTVFYHLYFNAFQPGSMMAERNRHLPDPDGRIVPRLFNLGPDEIGFHEVLSLTQDGTSVPFRVTDTVMKVDLARPIPPGGTAVFAMRFRSQVPLQTRRSGRDNAEGVDYSMSQWYPKLAAYDVRGWHADPYVGREFYAPFGTFDVRLTLPADYVVGATGVLQNPRAIGHGYADVPPPAADSLTWHFRADDVHDFAWVADPDYLHDQIAGDGITYHLLYLPDVAERWKPMRAWVPALIEYYSARFGRYPYPQFTVAQAGDGGMEYPMINFNTGRRSPGSLLGVTAHEAAHEWFYATLANNEALYPWMDEGFTSYATGAGVAHIAGVAPSYTGTYLGYLNAIENGILDRPHTPSDWHDTNASYGTASYTVGSMIADMLGYVMGDETRDAFFHEYFRRFTFKHPHPYDVEKTAEDVSGLQLDWFFEQFLNTTRPLDYAVDAVDSRRDGDRWTTDIELEREGTMVMPLDVRLTLEDGSEQWVNIPLGLMQGHKPVPDGWTVAAPWLWTFPEYILTVETPAKVVRVEIDPMERMPDRNRLNNASRFPVDVAFLRPPSPSWSAYGVGVRPLGLYAHDYGFGAGVQARGAYLFGRHQAKVSLTLWPEVLASGGDDPAYQDSGFPTLDSPDEVDGSALDGIDYEVTYATRLPALGPAAGFAAEARKHLGFMENTASVTKNFGEDAALGRAPERRVTLTLAHQHRTSNRVFRTPGVPLLTTLSGTADFPFPDEHLVSALVSYRYERGGAYVAAHGEVGTTLGSLERGERRVSANRAWLDFGDASPLGPFTLHSRLRLGVGAQSLTFHKRFRLGAASFEERWRHAAFRNLAAAFEYPLDDAHLAALSDVGPVAYLLNEHGGRVLGAGPGRMTLASRLTIETPPPATTPWLRPLTAEVFFGIGTVTNNRKLDTLFRDLVADGGFGVRYNVSALRPLRRWVAQSDALSGLALVAQFPIWASDPGLIDRDESAFAFRWLLGVAVR